MLLENKGEVAYGCRERRGRLATSDHPAKLCQTGTSVFLIVSAAGPGAAECPTAIKAAALAALALVQLQIAVFADHVELVAPVAQDVAARIWHRMICFCNVSRNIIFFILPRVVRPALKLVPHHDSLLCKALGTQLALTNKKIKFCKALQRETQFI